MNNIFTKEWLIPALNRAVRTMVQVALTMFTITASQLKALLALLN